MKKFILAFLLSFLAIPTLAFSDASFTWSPNTETDLAGYKIYYSYLGVETVIDVGNVTRYTVVGNPDGMADYWATAYDINGNESDKSTIISHDPPPAIVIDFEAISKVTIKIIKSKE